MKSLLDPYLITHDATKLYNSYSPEEIITALQTLYQWFTSENPESKPLQALRVTRLTSTRRVQEALLTLDSTEYDRLEDFYSTHIRREEILETLIERSNGEFKFLREYCGYSQTQLAELLHTSLSSERRWENKEETYTPPLRAWQQLDKTVAALNDSAQTLLQRRIAAGTAYDYDDRTGETYPASATIFPLFMFDNTQEYGRYILVRRHILSLTPNQQSRLLGDSEQREYVKFIMDTEGIEPLETFTQHNALMRIVYTLAATQPVEHIQIITNPTITLEKD